MKKSTILAAAAAAAMVAMTAGANIKTVSVNTIDWTGSNQIKTAADARLGSFEVEYTGGIRLDVLMVSGVENIGGYDYIMTGIDQNGHEWQVVDEDLCDMYEGDIIAVMFDDMGTISIYDDEIIAWRYSGWVSDAEMASWVK